MKHAASQPARGLAEVFFSARGELIGSIVASVLLAAGATLQLGSAEGALHRTGDGLLWTSLALGMVYGTRASWGAISAGVFDIDVLMALGAVMAAAMGAPGEGALLLVLFTMSGALEDLAMQRTTRAVEAISRLIPSAALRQDPGSGAWGPVAPESLVAGDRVRILPGELVPADGTLVLGESSFDQATLTGESMARDVRLGDEVFSGTINVANPVEIRITRAAAQSSLQRIVDLVTTAQQQRQPVQRFIDRFSQPYSMGVVVVSAIVFLAMWLGGGVAVKDSAYAAMTLLIVASPCALIIATPTATLAAISRAARGGVLFKGGQSIERLARLGAIGFDKTGTLTIGRPRVVQVLPIDRTDATALLSVAAALEEHSTHPIARAIVSLAEERGVPAALASDFKATAGRGVSALVDGHEARLGSLAWTRELIAPSSLEGVSGALASVQHRGQIGVVCVHDGRAGVFVLADGVRPGAECLVERLHALGVRPVVMLTGDNELTARRVAEQLGLDEFHAQLLPQDKVARVTELKAKAAPRLAGVIGDGVNDAPALSAADASIAIGSIGSDAALESADVVLLSDDLSAVPWAVALARRARRTIAINLSISLGAILIMVAAVLLGRTVGYALPLWLGVLGHEGGTLLVVAHSLALLAFPGVPLCVCDRHSVREAGTPLTVSAAAAA